MQRQAAALEQQQLVTLTQKSLITSPI